MIKIKNERDLEKKIAALRAYVMDCVKRVKRAGLVLQRGAWIRDYAVYGDPVRDPYAVCAVGAIGCAAASRAGLRGKAKAAALSRIRDGFSFAPRRVVPLVRNGATDLIDEPTLWALSDGFEGAPEIMRLGGGRSPGRGLQAKYRQAAFALGRELAEDRVV